MISWQRANNNNNKIQILNRCVLSFAPNADQNSQESPPFARIQSHNRCLGRQESRSVQGRFPLWGQNKLRFCNLSGKKINCNIKKMCVYLKIKNFDSKYAKLAQPYSNAFGGVSPYITEVILDALILTKLNSLFGCFWF